MAKDNGDSKGKSKKPSKKLIYLLIILIVIFAECTILYYDHIKNEDSVISEVSNNVPIVAEVSENVPVLNDFLNNGTDSFTQAPSKRIGKNDIGTVSREGPYGNNASSVKVAYILGQHPREANAHDAIYTSLQNSSSELDYCYYVYKINVTSESEDFEESRMNGQLLAEEFVVGDVIKRGYDLAIDIHSSNGGYVQDPYIFAPVSTDEVAYGAANNLTSVLNYIIYYEPASYSSPQYSTIPIEEGGVPAIVYEMRGNPDRSLETEADDFISAVDNLSL